MAKVKEPVPLTTIQQKGRAKKNLKRKLKHQDQENPAKKDRASRDNTGYVYKPRRKKARDERANNSRGDQES